MICNWRILFISKEKIPVKVHWPFKRIHIHICSEMKQSVHCKGVLDDLWAHHITSSTQTLLLRSLLFVTKRQLVWFNVLISTWPSRGLHLVTDKSKVAWFNVWQSGGLGLVTDKTKKTRTTARLRPLYKKHSYSHRLTPSNAKYKESKWLSATQLGKWIVFK